MILPGRSPPVGSGKLRGVTELGFDHLSWVSLLTYYATLLGDQTSGQVTKEIVLMHTSTQARSRLCRFVLVLLYFGSHLVKQHHGYHGYNPRSVMQIWDGLT